ncbi:MAG: LPS assembly lipoprotein LptE [Gammaproteobacteria bacterium]
MSRRLPIERLQERVPWTLLIVVLIAGCGYHLRGSEGAYRLQLSKVYVSSQGAGTLAAALISKLQESGVTVAGTPAEAQAVIVVSNEIYDRRVLSVDQDTGKVLEYELGYEAGLTITDPSGRTLVEPRQISLIRDITFDPQAVLGQAEEEQAVRNDMQQDAAQSVMFRLQAATSKK